MSAFDPERERQRLAQMYGSMSDEELEKIANDAGELSEIALRVLADEVRRRGLNIALAESAVTFEEVAHRNLVVVRQFRDIPEALLAKGMLESAAIECFLVDDNMVRLDWFISNLLGGVKLAVNPEDAETALGVLSQPIPEDFEVEGLGAYQQPRCPKCGSVNISHEPSLDKRIALPALYIPLPVPVPRDLWKCASCGVAWREEPDEAGTGGSA